MLKVLVVDDDKLVRGGLITMMPWAEFGMQVVGEANNGEKALTMMEELKVDLLITDLAMPIMSGMDLMRNVKALYPQTWMVVLSFHQDFELVQEALRLGAIDYIAKAQMEQEKLDEVLGRISNRIRHEQEQRAERPVRLPLDNNPASSNLFQERIAFIALNDEVNMQSLVQCSFVEIELLSELDRGLFLLNSYSQELGAGDLTAELSHLQLDGHWAILRVQGGPQRDNHLLGKRLREYKEYSFFYEYEQGKSIYIFNADNTDSDRRRHQGDFNLIRDRWSTLHWVIDDELFQDMIQEIVQIRPTTSQLESIFYAAKKDWYRIVPDFTDSMDNYHSMLFWVEWKKWLKEVRIQLSQKINKPMLSNDISHSILNSVQYIQQNLSSEIRQDDAAKAASMSRSYFSLCFKQTMGKSFNDYVRDERIDLAQKLLEQTTNPIYKVAEQCGYPNEKYFSRVFREQKGLLPSEYRAMKGKG